MTKLDAPALARLYRPVNYLPADTLCKFVPEQNLLLLNRELWARLSDQERYEIMRTPRTIVVSHPYAIDHAA